MNKLSKKLLSFLALTLVLSLSVGNTFVNVQTVLAENNNQNNSDKCGDTKTYEINEGYDSFFSFDDSNGRVQIDFNGKKNERDEVIITAGKGYEITSVSYDTETNKTNWNSVSPTNPVTQINLSGNSSSKRIDKVKVTVKKVCPTATYVCNQDTETTWSDDGSDEAVTVNFYSDDEKVDISAQSGYKLVSVHYDAKGGNTNWVSVSLSEDSVTVNPPNNTEVGKVKIVAKKVCTPTCTENQYLDNNQCVDKTPVCTDPLANNDVALTDQTYSDDSQCDYDEATFCLNGQEVSVAVNQPAPAGATLGACEEPEPTDYCPEEGIQTDPQACELICEEGEELIENEHGFLVCMDCDETGTCEVSSGEGGSDDPTPTPTETVTPTPTDTPNTGGPGDGRSDGLSDGMSDGRGGTGTEAQVLGASTMANTGNFAQTLANTALTFGLMLLSLSGIGYAKKNTKNK